MKAHPPSRKLFFCLPLAGLIFCLAACIHPETDYALRESPKTDSILALEAVTVELPYAPNVDLVETYCVPCHSLRYIVMQPQLTRKAWTKIVDKMIHAFGAPVRDSVTAARIVDYLVAVRGKP